MNDRPNGKPLRVAPFAAHSARGLIRNQRTRRLTMSVVLAAAVGMIVCGSTFLRELLNPREHAGWFIVFWLSCAWLTVLALLLGLFDLLLIRARNRAERKALAQQFSARD